MRRTRFNRPQPSGEDRGRGLPPTAPVSTPATPLRAPDRQNPPESTMLFHYGPSSRRRPTVDERDMRFLSPAARVDFRPAARASRDPVVMPDKEVLLQVTGLDLHITDNAKLHHTEQYEETENRTSSEGVLSTQELVVRRGAQFKITLTLGRPFKAEHDNLHLVFEIGTMPRPQWRTMVTVPIKKDETGNGEAFKQDRSNWSAIITDQVDNTLTVSVYIAADCIIGEWDLSVYSIMHRPLERPKIYVYDHPDNVFILLNPWSPDDTVYMPDTSLLEEYVLNDTGGIFVGNYKQFRPRPWFFGQFEEGILEVALHLLRRAFGFLISTKMSDPVEISRALSKLVNANDDRGVVVGRWDGKYEDGKTPSEWTGSVAILDEYDKTGAAVKYGQCWVFSGVLTTVCRAVGLPCRSVSNFKSAHDTNGNTTIDRLIEFDENGEVISRDHADSIWNFHVWNDAWMSRPDLPNGNDGWQTIDSTPQELSEGSFQCGPSPIVATKAGNIHYPYDTPFVFSEVNGHIVYWEVKPNNEWKQVYVDKFEVGKWISTKVPNGKPITDFSWGRDNQDRHDITLDYKHADGSAAEEAAMEIVNKQLELGLVYQQPKKDIQVRLKDILSINAGEDVEIEAVLENHGKETRTVSAALMASIITYNGVGIRQVLMKRFPKEKVKPGTNLVVNVTLRAADYVGYLVSNGSILVKLQGRVQETDDSFFRQDDFVVKSPELDIELKVDGQLTTRKPFTLEISFKNPLNVPLTGCHLQLSGPGLLGRTYNVRPRQTTVNNGDEFRHSIRLLSRRAGVRELVITLNTDQLPDIFGTKSIFVFYV